jgi:preprotein translocase subunit SecE
VSGDRNDDAIAVDDDVSSGSNRPSGKRTSRLSERRADREDRATTSTSTLSRPRSPTPAEPTRRGNPINRLIKFFREVVTELRKVIWPNRKQMATYTTVVLVFLAVMVSLIGGLDFGFIKAVSWLFG